jgi:hypothetical protein
MKNQMDFDIRENMLAQLPHNNNEHQNESSKHFKYEKPIEYWLLVIGYAIGYGSFWRFPYLIYSCG